jgi:O-antigen ligase
MSTSSKSLQIVMCLALLATTLPIFAGYTFGFAMLAILMTTGAWRVIARRPAEQYHAALRNQAPGLDNALSVLRPITIGCGCLVFAHLAAAVTGVYLSPWSKSLGASLSSWVHTAVKYGLLWCTLSAGAITGAINGWTIRKFGPVMFTWLLVMFVYVVFQHWTGIDWVHGLDARLGSHRYAYGVYRVSGLMGHPLTFAYNMMLVGLACLALAWDQPGSNNKYDFWWLGSFFMALVMLLISGSRYVLIVMCATLVICEGGRLWSHRWRIAPILLGIMAVLWIEGSAMSRFSEVIGKGEPLTERFPRVVFWKLHWRMFIENPVAGVTRSGLKEAMQAYCAGIGGYDTIYEAHNLFLQYLADTGVIGFLGLMLWVVGLLIAWKRLASRTSKGVSYLAVATFLSALMQNNLRDSAFVYALWFYLGALIIVATRDQAIHSDPLIDEPESPKNFIIRPRAADSPASM